MRCVFTATASQTLDGRDAPPPVFGGTIDALRLDATGMQVVFHRT